MILKFLYGDFFSSLTEFLRPLETNDESAFKRFLGEVPEIERMFIKQHLDDPKLLKRWHHDLDYESELPLLALADVKIIGLTIYICLPL